MNDLGEYSFRTLSSGGLHHCMDYMLLLVESTDAPETFPEVAQRILAAQYDSDDSAISGDEVLRRDSLIKLGFSLKSYRPLTPVLVANAWSPLEFLISSGVRFDALRKTGGASQSVTAVFGFEEISKLPLRSHGLSPDEAFLVHLLTIASPIAKSEMALVCLAAVPGWSWEAATEGLIHLSPMEMRDIGRIIWRRTPKNSGNQQQA